MSKDKKRLGRGLSAILGGNGDTEVVRELPVDQIRPNPHQPRRHFPEEAMAELVESVRVHGIVQPLIVVSSGDGYTLVAGERRWRAAQMAGLQTVPAIIRELDPLGMTEVALIENLQREDLTPIEEAHAYKVLQEEFALTQEAIAQRVGKSRSQVANTLRLLTLDPEVQREVDAGRLTMGHAKLLLSVPDGKEQQRLARLTIEHGWTVRELAGQISGGDKKKASKRSRATASVPGKTVAATIDPHWRAAAEEIQRSLGTRVEIMPGANGSKGRIILEFYGIEDFERLYRLLTRVAQATG